MKSVFEKHPRRAIFVFIIFVVLSLAIITEVILRFTILYDIGYYTAIKKEGVYEYPYGTIAMNKDGYPDQNFDLKSTKPRIGYFGDSIVMGVGAGDGYRFGDLVEKSYPAYEHWTFGLMGNGIREDELFQVSSKYNLNVVVYGLNLNDFLPSPNKYNGGPVASDRQSAFEIFLQYARNYIVGPMDWLRGKSYLYTVLRLGLKNTLEIAGYGYTGFKAIEFYPSKNQDIIKDIADKFNETAKTLKNNGVDFCLVIFPYEMQVSDVAAQTYQAMGFEWEAGFENGSTQKEFEHDLNIPDVYNGLYAFKKTDKQSAAGTYFVYNKGDKIDFNHLNREGHAALAMGWMASKSCPFLR